MSERFKINTWTLTFSAFTVKLIGALFKVPLLRVLTDEGMGYFNTAYTVYAFLYLISTAGVPKGISILLSVSGKDEGARRKIEAVCIRTFFFFGIALSVFLCLFSFPLSSIVGNGAAGYTLLLMSPSLVFISLSGVLKGIFNEKRDFLTVAVSDVIESILKLSLGLFFAIFATKRGWTLPVVSAFSVLGITIGSVIGFCYLYRTYKHNKPMEIKGQKSKDLSADSILKKLFLITFPITMSAAVNSVSHLIDLGLIMKRLVAGGLSEEEAVLLYGNYTTLVIPMFAPAGTVASGLSLTALPDLCRVRNDKNEFSDVFHTYMRKLAFVVIPLSFGLFFYGDVALSILFPDASVERAAPLLHLLAPGMIISAYFIMVATALEAIGKQRASLLSVAAGSLVKIAISYYAIGNPDIGMKGAPLGTLASCGIALFIASVFLYAETGIVLSPMREFIFAFALCIPAFFSVSVFQKNAVSLTGFPLNFLSVLLGGGVYFVTLGVVYLIRLILDAPRKMCILH